MSPPTEVVVFSRHVGRLVLVVDVAGDLEHEGVAVVAGSQLAGHLGMWDVVARWVVLVEIGFLASLHRQSRGLISFPRLLQGLPCQGPVRDPRRMGLHPLIEPSSIFPTRGLLRSRWTPVSMVPGLLLAEPRRGNITKVIL